MKKKYIKPELYFEKYELSTHIAVCDFKYINSNEGACVAVGNAARGYEGWTLFASGEPSGACVLTPERIEDYCEQNGENGSNTWMS